MGAADVSRRCGEVNEHGGRLSVTHSVVSPIAVLSETRRAYAIDASVQCTLLKPGLNDTYLLRGDGSRHVVRVFGAQCPRPAIAYELELLLHLFARGVSVSAPVPAADGRLTTVLEAPEGTRELALFRFAEGAPMVWQDEEQCFLAGRLAAAIHTGSDDFESIHERPRLDLDELLEVPLRAVRPFLAHRPEDWAYLCQLAAGIRRSVAQAIDGGLDWGPCHGDFTAKNIHVADGVAVALDFERCAPGWRVYDFAPVYRATQEGGREAIWNAFIRGYTELRALGGADLDAVATFRVLRHFVMLGAFATNAVRWGALCLSDAKLDRWLRFFRKLETESGLTRAPARVAPPRPPSSGQSTPRRHAEGPPVDVTYSLLREDALAAEITRSYALETPTTCQLLYRGLNDTYLVTSPSERVVARVFRANVRTDVEIAYELDLLLHLSARGIPVAVPIATIDGRKMLNMAAPEGTRQLVLFTHADGEPLSWSREHDAYLAGDLAARIHTATDDFFSPHQAAALDIDRLITRPLTAIRPYLAERASDWRLLDRVAKDLRDRVQAAAEAGLDWGPCHGDFRPGRIFVEEDRQVTAFGFDRCGPGWRSYDFSMIRWGSTGHDGDAYWGTFLRAYAEVRPIGEIDHAALPVFHAVRRLWALGGRAENTRAWGTRQLSHKVLAEELSFLRAWEEQHPRGRDGN